jgi:hypothetical protein
MPRRRWGRWGLLSVLLSVGLVTFGVCVVWCKISSYWLERTCVCCVLVGCTEIVSICSDSVTVHMRRRGRRRVWLRESVVFCSTYGIKLADARVLFVIYCFCTSLLLLWALGILQCIVHSLYVSTPRSPEDDSVESKHVALLSHYMFRSNCCCVWLTFTPILFYKYFGMEHLKFKTLWQLDKCRIKSFIAKWLKFWTYIWTNILYSYFTLHDGREALI